jgi:hypothetical protein
MKKKPEIIEAKEIGNNTTRTSVKLPSNWDKMTEEEKTKWVMDTCDALELE